MLLPCLLAEAKLFFRAGLKRNLAAGLPHWCTPRETARRVGVPYHPNGRRRAAAGSGRSWSWRPLLESSRSGRLAVAILSSVSSLSLAFSVEHGVGPGDKVVGRVAWLQFRQPDRYGPVSGGLC